MDKKQIGERWKEVFDQCDDLITEKGRDMKETEVRFLEDTRERLSTYEANTYITVRQLNYLSDIVAKYKDPWEV